MKVSTYRSLILPLLAILLCISYTEPVTAAKAAKPAYTNFIKTKCNTTTYPSLCLKTLNPYASSVKANSTRLCTAALNVALKGARDATTIVSSLKGLSKTEAGIIKDCMEDVKDAMYELKLAVDAMGHLGDKDKAFQLSNAKTYASAALTDADSCTDGFSGRKVNPDVKSKINRCMAAIIKLSSNALSLINHLY